MKKTLVVLSSILIITCLIVSCDFFDPTETDDTFTVTFATAEHGAVYDAANSGRKVTRISVDSDTALASDGNKITIGNKNYYAIADAGYEFKEFSGTLPATITAATTITPVFEAVASEIKYMDWDESGKKLVEKSVSEYTQVTNSTTTLDAGKFYIVKGADVNTNGITVNGTEASPTILILCDGAKLTVNGGINVKTGKKIVITEQSNGTGTLLVTGSVSSAGIGGGQGGAAGTITINSGTVTATGGDEGAGIGGGQGGAAGTITINGGTVTATGGKSAAGIGSGCNCSDYSSGTITINSGTVTATGGEGYNSSMGGGAGIGGGYHNGCGTVNINGGTITATGKGTYCSQYLAEGIGGGADGSGGNINFNGDFSITYGTDKDSPKGTDLDTFLEHHGEVRWQYVYLTQTPN